MGERLVIARWPNGESFVLDETFYDALEKRAGADCEILEVEVVRHALPALDAPTKGTDEQ